MNITNPKFSKHKNFLDVQMELFGFSIGVHIHNH